MFCEQYFMKTSVFTSQEASLKYLALAMIGATLIFFATQLVSAYIVTVVLAFGIFVYHHRASWLIFGRCGGLANGLTALRALLLLGVVLSGHLLSPYLVLVLGIVILVLDGLDGYYARKCRTVSAFGDMFDKEVDALYVLSFGVLIVDQGLAGSWIVLPGLLRYSYVVALSLLDRKPSPAGKSFRRQFVGMWLMGTLLAPFVLPSVIYLPGLIFATTIVILSFAVDFYQALLAQQVEVEA